MLSKQRMDGNRDGRVESSVKVIGQTSTRQAKQEVQELLFSIDDYVGLSSENELGEGCEKEMAEKEFSSNKKQEIHANMMVDYLGEKIRVADIENQSLSFQQYKETVMSGYVRDYIYPKLNNTALMEVATEYKNQCSEPLRPVTTYNDALIHLIVPELLARIEELEKQNKR